jgi:hypothetical protein
MFAEQIFMVSGFFSHASGFFSHASGFLSYRWNSPSTASEAVERIYGLLVKLLEGSFTR